MINFYLYNIRSNSDDLRCLLRTSGYYLLRRNDACTVLFVVIGVHEILNIAVEQCVSARRRVTNWGLFSRVSMRRHAGTRGDHQRTGPAPASGSFSV